MATDAKDEELNIDFSKLKGFFRKKEKSKTEEPAKKEDQSPAARDEKVSPAKAEPIEKEEENNLSIDFSKVKGFFSRKEASSPFLKPIRSACGSIATTVF